MKTQTLLIALKGLKPIFRTSKPSHKILTHVLIESIDNHLQITGTDLVNFMISRIPYDGEPIRSIVPYSLLSQWLERVKEDVQLESTPDGLRVFTNRFSYDFKNQCKSDDFLVTPEGDGKRVKVAVDRKQFIDSLVAASKSRSTSVTKYVLQGVRVVVDNGVASIYASDGHTACRYQVGVMGGDCEFTLKAESIDLFKALQGDIIDLEVYSDGVQVSSGDIQFMSRTWDQQYPNVEGVLPKVNGWNVAIPQKTFRVSVKVNTKDQKNKDTGTNLITLTADHVTQEVTIESEIGKCSIPSQVKSGFTATINAVTLGDLIQAIKSTELLMSVDRRILSISPLGGQSILYIGVCHSTSCEESIPEVIEETVTIEPTVEVTVETEAIEPTVEPEVEIVTPVSTDESEKTIDPDTFWTLKQAIGSLPSKIVEFSDSPDEVESGTQDRFQFVVNELLPCVDTIGMEEAAKKYGLRLRYVQVALNAYENLYLGSKTIKRLYDSGQISWAKLYRLGRHNPSKMGMDVIEDKAMTMRKAA